MSMYQIPTQATNAGDHVIYGTGGEILYDL